MADEIASGALVPIAPAMVSESAYYFVYPERKRNYYPVREFSRWMKEEISVNRKVV